MPTGSAGRQGGFTYVGMVILVAILGLVGASTLKVDALLRRAAAEQELLFAGAAFADALTSYAAATPQGQPTQPAGLQDLLRDTRTPAVRRHLRKIYVDPMTNSTDWGIVWLADGKGVLAVYSKSAAQPLKIANFDSRLAGFENKQHISDWRFVATGPAPLVPPVPQVPASVKPPLQNALFPAAAAPAPGDSLPKTNMPAPVAAPKADPPVAADDEQQSPVEENSTREPQRQ